jgi:bleomycin hydrolase
MTRTFRTLALGFAALAIVSGAAAQDKQVRPVFDKRTDAMLDTISARMERERKPADKGKQYMMLDFSKVPAPKQLSEFTQIWHLSPVMQGLSGMCWCFSTTSMLESEIHRLTGRSIKLSELHTVYWEHVEKAREFVRTRGKSHLAEGSEGNAVFRIWKKYGCVPGGLYSGLQPGQQYHDHENTLFPEIKRYLDSVRESGAWNEDVVIATVRSILDHHLGAPPAAVSVDGDRLTPLEYLARVVKLDPDDYVDFLSFMQHPYYTKIEFEVPDNWWHSKEYHNVPLADFMTIIKRSLRKGYSIGIGGDFSEPGYSRGPAGVAVVAPFDIPPDAITEEARMFRFNNGTTSDDHGLHIVGYLEKDGRDWYLVKDSWSSAYNSTHPGYYFFHEDYVKLKMLGCTVHRDAVQDILAKFPASAQP